MTQLQKALRIIETTPGHIAHSIFEQAGIKNPNTMRLAGMSMKNGMWMRR